MSARAAAGPAPTLSLHKFTDSRLDSYWSVQVGRRWLILRSASPEYLRRDHRLWGPHHPDLAAVARRSCRRGRPEAFIDYLLALVPSPQLVAFAELGRAML